jgi:hypothetical protein
MTDPSRLTPATQADLEQALVHALQFDGRKSFRLSGEAMAKITASHLAECLRRGGFVIMKRPPATSASYSPRPNDTPQGPGET